MFIVFSATIALVVVDPRPKVFRSLMFKLD